MKNFKNDLLSLGKSLLPFSPPFLFFYLFSNQISLHFLSFFFKSSPYWMAPEVPPLPPPPSLLPPLLIPLPPPLHTQMIEMSGHDLSSDIWSLGCVVVELLTGKPPYFDLDPMAAMFNIVESGGVVPDGVGPELAVCVVVWKILCFGCYLEPN